MTMIKNLATNETLATKVTVCRNPWTRLKGLLGTRSLPPAEACWISPCRAVHTFGMRYPIDVYFLDRNRHVVAVSKGLKPNRLSPIQSKAHSVVEFSAGDRRLSVGDPVAIDMPAARGFWRSGQAMMVETAFTIVFLAVFLLGLVQAAKIMYTWIALQHAVTESARFAALGGVQAGMTREQAIKQRVINIANGMGVQVTPGMITFHDINGATMATAGNPGEYFRLQANFNYQAAQIPGTTENWGTFTMSAKTVIKNERF